MTLQGQPGAIQMPVPNTNVFPGYWGNKPKWVVIHKTASGGGAQDIANFFIHDPNMASSHYVVGQDGTIVQCVSELDGAGANGILETGHASFLPTNLNLNLLTLSIEHVDPKSDNSTPLTDAQKAASFKLVHDVCQRHGIPMRRGDASGGIIGHSDIAPIDRARCPGNYPWQELWDFLKGNSMIDINHPWIKRYFRETSTNPHRWMCDKTGFALFAGVLAGWRSMYAAPRLPISAETKCGNRAVYQKCESGIVVWDPDGELDNPGGPWGECYLLKYGSDLGKKLLGIAEQKPGMDLSEVTANAKALASDLADAETKIADANAKAGLILKEFGI